MSSKGAVLLTGGTGFVGATLAPLLKARGWRVHALARRTSDSSTIAEHVERWHTGDLTDRDSLARAVAALSEEPGESWCCHLGAMISYRPRDRALQQRVNVEGTGALVDALVDGGVPRLLHVSSTAAVGVAASAKEELDESSSFESLRRIGAAYPLTKRAAEERALGDPRLERVVATNPGAIFGGGGAHNNSTKFLLQVDRRGAPPVVPPGSLGVVGVEDVAEGCCLAWERGRHRQRYLLVESNHTLRELFQLVAGLLGRRGPGPALPRAAWRAFALSLHGVDRLVALDLLAPEGLDLLGQHFRFSGRRARTELGWSPQPIEAVLRGTIAWLTAHGHLRSGKISGTPPVLPG